MKKFTSTPTAPETLQRDGGILNATFLLIIGCVLFSVITEFTFFFFSFVGYMNFTKWLAYPIAFLVAAILIYLIESKGIEFLIYSIDTILFKRVKENLALFIFSCAVVVFCYTVSVSVSLFGVPSISKKFVDPVTLSTTGKIDSNLTHLENDVNLTYSNDSLLIANSYKSKKEIVTNEYGAKIAMQQTNIDLYQRKAQRTGQSFTSRILVHTGKIKTLRNEQAAKVAVIDVEKNEKLTVLSEEKKTKIKATRTLHTEKENKIINSNNEKENAYTNELESTKTGLGMGVFISIPLLFCCVIIQRIIFKKSGIITVHQFDDYFYRQSILSKLANLLRVKMLQFAHAKLDKKFKTIEIGEVEIKENIVFNRSDLTTIKNPLDLDPSQQNMRAATVSISATVPPRKNGKKNNKGTIKKKSLTESVWDGTAIEDGTHGDTSKETARGRNGDGSGTHGIVYLKGDVIKCLRDGCNTTFAPFPKSKKFCSTKCRKANFKNRTGREPMMKKKR